MIIGFHLSWTTYGQWFPNDPRGSWSDEVWKPELADVRALDEGAKVKRPRAVPKANLQEFLDSARATLLHGTVWLNAREIEAVGDAFGEIVASTGWAVWACAILSNHAHLAVERQRDSFERMVNRFKGRSAQRVRELRGLKVAGDRRERVPIWTRGYWVRYIDDGAQMDNVIAYVRRNGFREGRGFQNWGFVKW